MSDLIRFREYLLLREREIRQREDMKNELIEVLQTQVYLNNFIENENTF